MRLIDVEPIGEETGPAFVDGPGVCQLRMVTRKVYPDSGGRAFRDARVAAGVRLREMAQRLGIHAAELSEIECGALVPEDWDALWRAAALEGRT